MGHRRATSFEAEWPTLARDLKAMLSRRGVPDWLIDDVVQETGIKLWRMWGQVDPERNVTGLGKVVATNILRDHWRRGAKSEVLGQLPDRPVPHDVEDQTLARSELRAVARALGKLRSDYQRVLLAEVGLADQPANARAGAIRMLRLRARRELATLVERASGFGAIMGGELVRLKQWIGARIFHPSGRRHEEGLAFVAAGLVASVAMGVMLYPHGASGGPGDASATDPSANTVVYGSRWFGSVPNEVSSFVRDAATKAQSVLHERSNRPLAKARLGRMGEIGFEGNVDALGLRVGTGDDGSLFVGCSDGTQTGATGVGRCKIGSGRIRASGEVRYRTGVKSGRVRADTDPD